MWQLTLPEEALTPTKRLILEVNEVNVDVKMISLLADAVEVSEAGL